MANGAHAVAAPWFKRWTSTAEATPLIPRWSSAAALRALRAAIIIPGLFALADKVIGNLQMATFAAFGGFATLVLASFAGTRRQKLVAHAVLAVAGSVLLTIGTAVSSSTLLAAIVTVPVTFAVFFAGAAGPNAASGVTGALLAYVLPAASPGTIAMIPDRLAGWWMASVAGTAAVLLLSPRPGDDRLRAAASTFATELAEQVDAALSGTHTEERLKTIVDSKHALMAQFTATPYRPTGLTTTDQALGNSIELLEWCGSLLIDAIRERADLRQASAEDRELLHAASEVLKDVSSLFAGEAPRPDLDRLEQQRRASLARLERLTPSYAGFREEVQISFHAHTIADVALALGADALVAAERADRDGVRTGRDLYLDDRRDRDGPSRRVARLAGVAVRDASVRSIWFVNSVRGALALAVSVAVADLSSVQHGFWVVLGTLSVLRTNASSTGSTAARALAGTAVGFVIGGALLVAIGSDTTALWVVLPIAVFVAAYAPGTAPFVVGQAAFTVLVAILFNLLAPVGWKVGVLRIEDVALGCGVSVLAGVLLWPHGLASLVGDDLADAFRSGAAYLRQATQWASGSRTAPPDAGRAASEAALRLDDALRAFLTEQGTKHIGRAELWRLVGGSTRLRLTAYLIAALPPDAGGMGRARDAVAHRTTTLVDWYRRLAELLGRPHAGQASALDAPVFGRADMVGVASVSPYGIWLCEHLDHLSEGLADLLAPASRVAEVRRRPWWR